MQTPQVSVEEFNSFTITNAPHESLGSLSKKHNVLLIFLRSFHCAFCKNKLAAAGDYFEDLMNLNTVPVFVHMEDESTAENFMCSFPNKDITRIYRIADPTSVVYKKFGIGDYGFFELLSYAPQVFANSIRMGYINEFTPKSNEAQGVNHFRKTSAFFIKNCKIMKQIMFDFSLERADKILQFAMDALTEDLLAANKNSDDNTIEEINIKAIQELKLKSLPVLLKPRVAPKLLVAKLRPTTFSCTVPQFEATSSKEFIALEKAKIQQDNKKETKESNANEENRKSLTVKDCLENKKCKLLLKQFIAKEHSIENYNMWVSVKEYKKLSDNERKEKAEEICNAFLGQDAIMQVNIANSLVTSTKMKLNEKGATVDLFDDVISELELTVLSDSFNRFKTTPVFKQLLNKL